MNRCPCYGSGAGNNLPCTRIRERRIKLLALWDMLGICPCTGVGAILGLRTYSSGRATALFVLSPTNSSLSRDRNKGERHRISS